MNVKYLIVLTLIFCSLFILPVNAEGEGMTAIVINDNGHDFTVTNKDTVYLWAGNWRQFFDTYVTVASKGSVINNKQITKDNHGYTTAASVSSTFNAGTYNLNQLVNSFDNSATINGMQGIPYALNNPQHASSLPYTFIQGNGLGGLSNTVITGTIYFNYDDNYTSGLDSARIIAEMESYTDTTVTYNVKCISDYPQTIVYTEIGDYTEFSLENVDLYEDNTEKTITIGLNGISVYSWSLNLDNGNIKQLQLYLNGRSEITDPSPSPTDQPVYPQRIQAFIQTYDYQNGNMLSGVNLSVYEVTNNNNNLQIGNRIYSSINAESQTVLTLKNNTEYFVKNEKAGYFSVKNTVYPSLNNETGYLWNPSLVNPLRLYYSRLDENAQYNANFIVQDVYNNAVSGVSVTMDNSETKISNSIGGLTFNNITAGQHTFIFVKNGYQTVQRTINIEMQYAAFYQTMYKDNQIIQPTVSPTGMITPYPTVQPTMQPTISPIEKPSNIADSVKYGLSKIFGVNSLDTINLVFALMLILFPAVIGGVITNQALGFIAGGMMGFVFALAIGLIPIWVFFAMVMFAVIYLVLTRGTGEGF